MSTCLGCTQRDIEIARITKLLCGATCVYCGYIAEPEVLTQDIGNDILKAHIAGCEKHPLTQARKQIATLQATLEATERERDSFQRIGKHYESVLSKAAELIAPGGCGRTAALVVTTDLPKLIAKLEAAERELIVYKGGHALDGGTLASLWAERDALRTALAAAHEDVRAMTRAICEAAIVIEALGIAERGGTALCPEMQTQITIAASGMRAALTRPSVKAKLERT